MHAAISKSATIFFSREFSSSSSRSRIMSVGSMPAYFFFQLKYVAELIPALRQISATAVLDNKRLLRVRKLRCFHAFPLLSQPGKF
jgi:hypothetical protein